MNAEHVWEDLIAESVKKPIELITKTGLHFKIVSNGQLLIVCESEIEPSSKLKQPRKVYKDNFKKVFPYYKQWVTRERGISKEITAITNNSVYIMAAIKYKMVSE